MVPESQNSNFMFRRDEEKNRISVATMRWQPENNNLRLPLRNYLHALFNRK